jgi:hypothetical protein
LNKFTYHITSCLGQLCASTTSIAAYKCDALCEWLSQHYFANSWEPDNSTVLPATNVGLVCLRAQLAAILRVLSQLSQMAIFLAFTHPGRELAIDDRDGDA